MCRIWHLRLILVSISFFKKFYFLVTCTQYINTDKNVYNLFINKCILGDVLKIVLLMLDITIKV